MIYGLLNNLIFEKSLTPHRLNSASKYLQAHDSELIAASGHRYLEIPSITPGERTGSAFQEMLSFISVAQVCFGFAGDVEHLD